MAEVAEVKQDDTEDFTNEKEENKIGEPLSEFSSDESKTFQKDSIYPDEDGETESKIQTSEMRLETTGCIIEKSGKDAEHVNVELSGEPLQQSPEVIVDPQKLARHSKERLTVHKSKTISPKYSKPLPKILPHQLKPVTPPAAKTKTGCSKKIRRSLKLISFFVLILMYIVGGAYIFSFLEVPNEKEYNAKIDKWKNDTAVLLATELRQVKPHEDIWAKTVFKYLELFERDLLEACAKGYRRTDDRHREQKWTWSSSFLFSLSLLTTTGYGSMTPRSEYGRGVVYFYSWIGVPLMMFWLIAFGNFLANCWASIFGCFSLHDENQYIRPKDKNQKIAAVKSNTVFPLSEVKLIENKGRQQLNPLIYSTNPATPNGMIHHFNSYRNREIQERTELGERSLHLSIKFLAIGLCVLFFDAYFIVGSVIIAFYEEWSIQDSLYYNHLMLFTFGPGYHELEVDTFEINMKHKLYYSSFLFVGYCLMSMTANLVFILFFLSKTKK